MLKKSSIILAIMGSILLVSIIREYNAKSLAYYKEQEKLMRISTINYFKDNPYYLPIKNKESKRVVISSLIDEKYLEKIRDKNGLECNYLKSYVEVVKVSTDTYTYHSHLVCPKYQTEK